VAVPVSVVILSVLTMMEKDKVSKDYLAYYEKIKGISDNEI
jgi:hypothetical protein